MDLIKNIGNVKISDNIKTPHGRGVVVGFEVLDDISGDTYLTNSQSNGRIVCRLVEGHTWTCQSDLYYLSVRDYVRLNEIREQWDLYV